MRKQIAHIHYNVYVGNYHVCDTVPFESVIHIWHQDQVGHCKKCQDKPWYDAGAEDFFEYDNDLFLWYKKHDMPTTAQIQAVMSFSEKTIGKLLVHCSAGIDRSPTLALAALAARSAKHLPRDSDDGFLKWLGVTADAMWHGYEIQLCPSFDCQVLNVMAAMQQDGKLR